jgi:hypothetical protein
MGVLANAFGGSTGQFGGGPTAVTAQGLTSEGFDLTKPFIQDVLEAGRAQFFEDGIDPETGDTVQQLAPFEQFTGPRLADFSGEQEEAFSGLQALARSGINTTPDLSSSVPYFQQAKDQAGLGSLAFTEADANRLMNPFLRGVTDVAKRESIRQFESTLEPKLRAEAASAGSFGGSRAAILEAEGQRNLQQQLSDIEERGLATAFEQAQKSFDSEKGRQLQSSALFSALGEAAPAQAARELALLSSVGEAKQAQEQAALNLAEKDFIEQREFPLRQLQEYQSLVRGFPFTPSTYQVTSQSQPQPSFGQQLLGTLGTGAGIFGALGGFSNKAGGQVVPRQSGGQVRGGLAGLERHQNNISQYNLPNISMYNKPVGITAPSRLTELEAEQKDRRDRNIGANLLEKISSLIGTPRTFRGSDSSLAARDKPVSSIEELLAAQARPTVPLSIAVSPPSIAEADDGLGSGKIPTSRTVDYLTQQEQDTFAPFGSTPLAGGEVSKKKSLGEEALTQIAAPLPGGIADTRQLPKMIDNRDVVGSDVLADDAAFGPQESSEVIEKEANVEKTQKAATTAAGVKTSVLDPKGLNNLINKKGTPLSDTYDELDTAFSDYLSFLEKKKGEGAERLSEAQEAREARLFAELAATSARFAGQAGPGGFLAKLNQAALPSIAELKNIQGDFRKESRAAKDIEGDILKDKLNINLAKTKLDMERSKLASENNLRAAKANAERTANVYGLEANEAYDKLVKSIDNLSISPIQKITVYKRFTGLLNIGTNPTSAVNTANAFALSLAKPNTEQGEKAGTAQATIDAAKNKIGKAKEASS